MSTKQTARQTTFYRFWHRHTSQQCVWSWYLHWWRHVHAHSCLKDSGQLLRSSSTTLQHQEISYPAWPVSGHCVDHVAVGLRQCNYGVHSWVPDEPPSVRPECWDAPCMWCRKDDHITHLLWDLHWLRVPECIQFRLATVVFCCRQNLALPYLANDLRWTDKLESLQRLRSGSMQGLIVPRTQLWKIGDRALGVTMAHVWNSLSSTVTATTSLVSFKDHLKTHLINRSYTVIMYCVLEAIVYTTLTFTSNNNNNNNNSCALLTVHVI